MLTSLAINTGGLGRFANNCFTIAGVIGIATKSGQPYAFPPWVTKDNAIFGEPPDNINDYLLNPLPALANHTRFETYPYFWGYQDLYLPTGNWTIDAHMQSEKFFKHCMPLIRDTFRFRDEPKDNEYENIVAVHWRAGDYIEHSEAQHPRCSNDYYKRAMELFPAGTKFLIFSDDIKAAQEKFLSFELRIDNEISFAVGNTYILDFAVMKKCHSFVCANSSFSLFAAILGEHPEKKIVCPRRWFGSQMPPEFGTEDIYPENAIVI